MGWTRDRFFNSEIDEFFKALIGFNELEIERQKVQWEQTRLMCFYSVAPHSKNIKKPTDLFSFEWEKEQVRETREAFLQRNAHLKELWDRLKKV